MSVRGFVSQMNLSVTYIENALFGETILFVTAVFRSYLRQFSMQMKYTLVRIWLGIPSSSARRVISFQLPAS